MSLSFSEFGDPLSQEETVKTEHILNLQDSADIKQQAKLHQTLPCFAWLSVCTPACLFHLIPHPLVLGGTCLPTLNRISSPKSFLFSSSLFHSHVLLFLSSNSCLPFLSQKCQPVMELDENFGVKRVRL